MTDPKPRIVIAGEVIAACRPVEWSGRYQVPGIEETPVYPGSVVGKCEGCDVDIYVGPRAQALTVPHKLLCFLCAIELGPSTVMNLGNSYRPRR